MGRRPRWQIEIETLFPRTDKELPAPDWIFTTRTSPVQPQNETEALMMCPPGGNVLEVHTAATQDTYEALDKTLGVELELDATERAVLDACCVSGLSVREAAEVLGLPKSTVHRIKTSALERIRNRINQNRLETGETE